MERDEIIERLKAYVEDLVNSLLKEDYDKPSVIDSKKRKIIDIMEYI